MKFGFLTAVIFSIACNAAFAAEGKTPVAEQKAKEEQCQKSVIATLENLEAISDKTGQEAKLKDLSALDIMNIASKKGVCAAQDEINRRTK
jgi:hypothetical protein